MKAARPYPIVTITPKGERAIVDGHPWVYEGEVVSVSGTPEDGGLADVVSKKGSWLGCGFYNSASKIRVRLVTRNANDDPAGDAFWERRLRYAWDYRKTVMGEADSRCCRIIFGEADGFPGLTVDRFERVLVAQVLSLGMERIKERVLPLLVRILREDGQVIRGVYERNDAALRTLEGMAQGKGWMTLPGEAAPEGPAEDITENGIRYTVDFENGQKTGFFLDQKYNRRAVRELAGGRRVLDCFCHVGPFGLNAAAGGAEFVRCVDVSQTAIDLAGANARLNGLEATMDFTCANVLEYLPELARDRKRLREEGGPFDLIVLDPPAFTKSRGTVEHASKGYREINYAAMRLLPRGGYLATCSCSHFMTTELLKRAIADAAHQANVQLKQIEERQQAPDHPILWGAPETHYLDFLTFQVV